MWFLLIALTPPSPETAGVAAFFHNRPGATPDALRAEQARCRTIAIGVDGSTVAGRRLTPPSGPGPLPRTSEPVRSDMDGCLAMRGWRRYMLSVRERDALARMGMPKREQVLARLIGAQRPAMGRFVQDANGLLRVPERR